MNLVQRVATFLTEAWSAYVKNFERIGQSIEAVPGWRHLEQALDDIAWGMSVGVGMIWLLRWWLVLMAAVVFLTAR